VTLRPVAAKAVGDVRRQVVDAALRAGLDQEAAERFTLAVNEIVINAIQHGGGIAEVTLTTERDRVIVEVRDHGRGIPAGIPVELPPPEQAHGRGLWLARRLCEDITLGPANPGAVVRLTATARR
jgi:anti-sigma regulatory factor (Ser/Thr protein kinase)